MSNNNKKPNLNLEKALKAKGMSKYEFSKRLGVQTSNSARYFKKGFNPTLNTLIKWAEVLECKISDLIEE
ncbi:MAG: helix-turn-helix transcriptional regulator [Bacteriovoracaceae bacterium]|nr:helix-turn-helix transcriptional regulator [Bacteriovoracaceae bacterium]